MYASPSPREKAATGLSAVAIVALIGFVLTAGLNVPIRVLAEHAMPVLDLRAPPPPPPETPKPPEPQKKARPMKHAASAENLKAKATPIVAPPPPIPLPPPPVIAATKPNIGAAAHNGASDRPGSGEGAGGVGDGLGGGGDGEGGDIPPRQIKGALRADDLPGELRGGEWRVEVRYAVNVDGTASDCTVTRSSGNRTFDQITCGLIERRFRFEPSRDGSGRPVHSLMISHYSWGVDRSGYDPG